MKFPEIKLLLVSFTSNTGKGSLPIIFLLWKKNVHPTDNFHGEMNTLWYCKQKRKDSNELEMIICS